MKKIKNREIVLGITKLMLFKYSFSRLLKGGIAVNRVRLIERIQHPFVANILRIF